MKTPSKQLFDRHRGPITCVTDIPGTSKVITAAYDCAVGIFDTVTGDVDLMGYHRHLVNRVTVNKAGTKAASCSSDYDIYLWNLETLKLDSVLRGHSDDVEDFVFIDEHTGASVSRDWRILVWNLDTGSIIRVIEGHEMDVLSIAYHNGKLFTSGDDMTMRSWDLETGKELRKWGPFETETDTCAIDTLNNRAILGCDDGVIRIFDIENGEAIGSIQAHKSAIKKVAISPVNGDILSAAYDQKILIWDAQTFEQKVALEEHATKWERSFNWTANGTGILAGTFDGTVLCWDAESGRLTSEIGNNEGNVCINDVDTDNAGNFAVVSDDGYIRLGKITEGGSEWKTKTEPEAGRMLMNGVAFSDEYNCVAGGAHNQLLHIFQKEEDALLNEIVVDLKEGPINAIRISNHAGFEGNLFVSCYSGAIVVLNPQGEILNKFKVHENAVKSLRLHPEKLIGVSGSADGILASWSFDGKLLRYFPGHTAIIDDVDIDPTGNFVASTGRDFTLKIYNLHDGILKHSILLGKKSPKGICFFDSNTVVVTNYWGELYQVDLKTEKILTKQIAQNGISSIANCGKNIICTSYDGSVYLVEPHTLTVLEQLEAMRQRVEFPSLVS